MPAVVWWRRRRARAFIILAAALLLPAGTITSAGRLWKRSAVVTAKANETGPEVFPQVWQVEQNKEFETYSNGLRVERRFEVSFEPRSFPVLPAGTGGQRGRGGTLDPGGPGLPHNRERAG